MSISEESHGALSLDALLGVGAAVEEPAAESEAPAAAPAASFELLSALGLALSEPATAESAQAEAGLAGSRSAELADFAPAEALADAPVAPDAAEPALDLAALLGAEPDAPSEEPKPAALSELAVVLGLAPEPADDGGTKRAIGSGLERAEESGADSEPSAESASVRPLRSRFADIPAFRPAAERSGSPSPKSTQSARKGPAKEERTEAEAPASVSPGSSGPVGPTEAASASKPVASANSAGAAKPASTARPAKPAGAAGTLGLAKPASPASPAVRYVVGESRPPALSASTSASTPQSKRVSWEGAAPVSGARAASAAVSADAAPASWPAAAAQPEPPSPASVPAAQAPRPTMRPLRSEPARKPATRPGIWYLVGACLFALALACTCYATYSSVASRQTPLASDDGDFAAQTDGRAFRYSVQGSDGAVRTVTEQVRLDADGFVTETTISFQAASQAEAAWFLDDAKSQFGASWVSGSVLDDKAVFTVLPGRSDLDAEAYEALLLANTTDCVVLN